MPWRSKVAALAATATIGLVLYLALAGPAGSTVVFGQVAQKLRAAQTLWFDAVVTFHNDERAAYKSRSYFMVPARTRQEMRQAEDEGFVVMDFPAGKALMVSTTQKTAMVSPIQGAAKHDVARRMIDDLRTLADKGSRPLGEKQIEGARARGFEIKGEAKTTTIWANAETGAPLRVEVVWTKSPFGAASEVMTNFHLDEKLDPALFSVEPPKGYKVIPFMPIDLDATPAAHAAALLKIYADHMEGEFPARLEDAVKSLAAKLGKPKPGEPPSEELQKVAFHGAAVAAVMMNAKAGQRWQYYSDVKLGQKDRIVFWYLDAKTDTYTAVYGDLRVEKVAKEQLPAASGTPR